MKTRKLPLGDRNLIGSRITLARKKKGMSQAELTAKLQVHGIELSSSAVSLLESQRIAANDYEIVALCKILEVTPAWLLGMEEK